METLFPNKTNNSHTIESVAGKLYYFQAQLQFIHWRTDGYAEHKALDGLIDYINSFKDDFIEKYMGYERRKINSLKIDPIDPKAKHNDVVASLEEYAHNIYEFFEEKEYCDLENKSQELSGVAAKTLYLLTLQ